MLDECSTASLFSSNFQFKIVSFFSPCLPVETDLCTLHVDPECCKISKAHRKKSAFFTFTN